MLWINFGSDGDYNFEEIIRGEIYKGKEDKMEKIYKFFLKDFIVVIWILYVYNVV